MYNHVKTENIPCQPECHQISCLVITNDTKHTNSTALLHTRNDSIICSIDIKGALEILERTMNRFYGIMGLMLGEIWYHVLPPSKIYCPLFERRFHYNDNVQITNGVQNWKYWVPKPLLTILKKRSSPRHI